MRSQRQGPKTCALLLAAGEGVRSGGRKQFRRAGGKSFVVHALEGLLRVREIGGVLLVVPADAVEAVEGEVSGYRKVLGVVPGGATRHLSSRAGLGALPLECEWVLIHDAARPFASPALIRRVLRGAQRTGAAIPVLEVHDSTVELDPHDASRVGRYLPRPRLRAVQTPQAFSRSDIVACFDRTRRDDFTDDASVLRRYGHGVEVVEGEITNRKVTTSEELKRALRELGKRARAEA